MVKLVVIVTMMILAVVVNLTPETLLDNSQEF